MSHRVRIIQCIDRRAIIYLTLASLYCLRAPRNPGPWSVHAPQAVTMRARLLIRLQDYDRPGGKAVYITWFAPEIVHIETELRF